VLKYLEDAVRNVSHPIIVEIGAARGEDTETIVRKIFDNDPESILEYYAFEPDPRNIAVLKRSPVIDCIHLIEAAVGETNHRALFNQSSGKNPRSDCEHTLSGSLKKPVEHLQAHPWCTFERHTEVRVIALNDFYDLYSLPHIDFIWCDVQGAEDLVLAGGDRALTNTHFFYTEYYENEMYEGQINVQTIHDRLPGRWRIVDRWPHDILFENMCLPGEG
jgi:2-O-methyltransferase